MNDNFREFKGRLRKLDEILVERGLSDADFAQALSRVRRAVKHGDRSRDPSSTLRGLLEAAEGLARKNRLTWKVQPAGPRAQYIVPR